jgi:hypothetical protein
MMRLRSEHLDDQQRAAITSLTMGSTQQFALCVAFLGLSWVCQHKLCAAVRFASPTNARLVRAPLLLLCALAHGFTALTQLSVCGITMRITCRMCVAIIYCAHP